mmetsp:Transcript_3484/g.5122  ORF Transcript_3484/g.5122 Transcript_3484/m.5122 type:complete len:133 (-) Transcript_3484:36-434(-)
MDNEIITFDENHQLRIFDPEALKQSEGLKQQSQEFCSKLQTFQETVQSVLGVLEKQGDLIENEKLMVIGMRNRVETEIETRDRKKRQLSQRIAEKNKELERLTMELNGLLRVEHEQQKLIDRMSNNEPMDEI